MTGRGRGSFWGVAVAVAWRSLRTFAANPALILPSLVFPLFFLLAFAGGLSSVGDVPGFDFPSGYTAFQFVWVLLQTAAFTGAFMGFNAAADFESGFARRLMLAAPRRGGIVAGYVLASLARAGLNLVLLFVVALIAGMQVDGSPLELIGLVLLALLVNVAGTLFALGVALRLRSLQGAPLMQTPIFIFLFLAPVWVPLELLQGWIEAAATVNPVSTMLEAGRGFISGEPSDSALAFGLVVAVILAFSLWARGGLRRAERAG